MEILVVFFCEGEGGGLASEHEKREKSYDYSLAIRELDYTTLG